MNLPLCLSGERKSFCGVQGGFFQKAPLLGSRPQTAGQSPIPLAPCKGKFPFRRNGITCYTIFEWYLQPP